MSTSIDERVVSMKFDNKQFESGVSTSLNSINNLKRGLNFDGATKGLDSISDSAKRVNFDGLASGVDAVRVKFSALQVIAVTALANIANSAIDAGKNLVSSLTIDPIMDGFKEYETQMNAIQTILANTSTKGTTLDEVKDSLSELNTYSDKTIYNFTEMTRNIGTFTAAGVDLKTSTQAIKGIANLAALSGSNSQQASTAMYQLSQALAAGKVNLQDWNSVVNAGMGGAVFQNALKETAKVMGKNVDESQSFRESISDQGGTGWLTSDVLLATLQKFTGDMSESQLAAQGYTEAQIKDIMSMGKTANDAATKVKTFTQLLDTLKEAVGSGWAQTWQTLFGDFDEAKDLFTNISNVLGGMISESSNARNSMLSGWKDLGGRTVLIDALKDAFNNLMDVVNTIGGAFREIFPATTSEQLFSLTQGLKNLIDNFKMSDTTLANLKSTFKGVFAVLDIGKTIFLALADAVGIIIGGVGNLGSSILGVTGSFGEWLTALDKTIKESGIFSSVITTLAYGIRNGFNGIASVITLIVNGIGNLISTVGKKIDFPGFEALHSFLEVLGNRMSSIGNESTTMATTVGGAFVAMGKSIADSKIGEIFKSIWETVSKIGEAIGELVGQMVDNISKSLSSSNFTGLFDAIGAISIGGVVLAVNKFLKSLSEPLEAAKGLFGNVSSVLDSVRGSLESWQQNLKASILLKIALAVGLLAASIVSISLIDSDKLVSSLAAIGTLFGQLLVAMKLYSLIGDFKGSVTKSSVVMLAMSTSILILASAMKKLSELDWNGLAKGIVGLVAISTVLVASAKILSTGSGQMIKGSTAMIAFALAIKVLASACSDLSKLDWNGLAKGLVGVGVLMTELSLFLNNSKFSAKSILTSAGIVLLAEAMKILATACRDFGGLSWSEIGKGLVSVGVLLTELSAFTNLTGNAKNVISTGLALVAIAGAMKILASAMNDFGNMSWESIAKGLVAMAGALTEITLAVNLLPSDMIAKAAALVVVGAALNIIAKALSSMGGMSWEEIAKGLVTLGGALGLLAIGLNAMTGSLAGSAALLVASAALAILAPALTLLGAMSWESIIKGLVDLAATITIFGAAAVLLTPIIPSMIGLAGAMALLGVSMLGIGAGLALVGVGLTGIATGFTLLAGTTAAGATAVVAALGIIITGVAALIPQIMEKIGEGILAFIKVFTDSIPQILQCITTIISAIIDCIVTNIPKIVDGVLQTLSGVLDAIIKWVPTITQQVLDIILAMLKVIADNVPKFITAATDIMVAFIQGISDNLPKIIEAAFNLIITFINGLADGIRNNSSAIADACLNLVTAIVDGIGALSSKFVEAGAYAVKGFIQGLASLPGELAAAAGDLGRSALAAAKKALDIHSPSRKFGELGKYSALGYINMLRKYTDKVADAGSNMGSSAISGMSNAISNISDIMSGGIDSQPVITPVIDLSNIQNGSKQLYSMMSNLDDYNINGSINTVNQTAKSISSRQLLSNPNVETDANTSSQNTDKINKKPINLQLVLQNGKAIAEYIIDDVDNLLGNKNKIVGRMVGGS
jgi:tape measure domain-containing protein